MPQRNHIFNLIEPALVENVFCRTDLMQDDAVINGSSICGNDQNWWAGRQTYSEIIATGLKFGKLKISSILKVLKLETFSAESWLWLDKFYVDSQNLSNQPSDLSFFN